MKNLYLLSILVIVALLSSSFMSLRVFGYSETVHLGDSDYKEWKLQLTQGEYVNGTITASSHPEYGGPMLRINGPNDDLIDLKGFLEGNQSKAINFSFFADVTGEYRLLFTTVDGSLGITLRYTIYPAGTITPSPSPTATFVTSPPESQTSSPSPTKSAVASPAETPIPTASNSSTPTESASSQETASSNGSQFGMPTDAIVFFAVVIAVIVAVVSALVVLMRRKK